MADATGRAPANVLCRGVEEVTPWHAAHKVQGEVRTGFWTCILSPIFWAGLSEIPRFWTYRTPAAVPVL